jgi:hypothetical protein
MSKRSSTNAKNFAGISWGFGIRSKKKSEKQEMKVKDRSARYEEQWDRMCKKFNFVLSPENKSEHDNLKLKFTENRKIKLKSLKNVACFKIYCQKNQKEFTLENYFNSGMNTFDFKKKLPEVYSESKRTKSKPVRNNRKKETGVFRKLSNSTNTVMNNLSDEIIKKLERIKNGL